MAEINAAYGFNYKNLNLNNLISGFYASNFFSDIFGEHRSVAYEDSLAVVWLSNDASFASIFAGTGFTFDEDGNLSSGYLQGYFEYNYSMLETWSIRNISYSAASMYNAALTSSTTDDQAIISSILSGDDTFYLSAYADRVTGYSGHDNVYGYGGNDSLDGGTGNDTLLGGTGNDILIGGTGKDTLTGGTERDYFDFDKISESGITSSTRDVIKDFSKSQGDKVDLRTIDAKTGGTSNDAFSFVSKAPTKDGTASNGKLWYTNGVLYGSTDNDKAAEFSIQVTLTGITASNAAEYIFL